jgi:hypothetical protein
METKLYTWRTRQEIEVCQDCIYVSANGMPKASDIVSEEIKLHADRYKKAVAEYGDEPYSDEDEPSFSWQSCDFCGDTNGGNRYTASVMQLHTDRGNQ